MEVIDWLLEGDPAIRWQVHSDLLGSPSGQVADERARVETEGWGARLLAMRDADGQWDGGACFPRRVADDWRAGIQRLLTGSALDLDVAHAEGAARSGS